jgi:hypothetical protein
MVERLENLVVELSWTTIFLFLLLMIEQLSFKITDKHKTFIEFLPLGCPIVDLAIIFCDSMMHRAIDINDFILLVKSEYFVTVLVDKYWLTVINVPEAAPNSIQPQYILTLAKPI